MKPVLILQHMTSDPPGYLGTWLSRQGLPMDLRNTEAGDPFPDSIDGYRALAILGGEMSANDDLPSLRRAEVLIRQAMASGVPTIGLCLGGQLMARALGATVRAASRPEIGWCGIDVLDEPPAREWFGEVRQATVFQWHAEAFDVPAGARRLASSPVCPNQAFSIGPHLALQFHIELDAAKLALWAPEVPGGGGAGLLSQATVALGPALSLADRLFGRWWSAAA